MVSNRQNGIAGARRTKSTIFWSATLCSPVDVIDVSEEGTAPSSRSKSRPCVGRCSMDKVEGVAALGGPGARRTVKELRAPKRTCSSIPVNINFGLNPSSSFRDVICERTSHPLLCVHFIRSDVFMTVTQSGLVGFGLIYQTVYI